MNGGCPTGHGPEVRCPVCRGVEEVVIDQTLGATSLGGEAEERQLESYLISAEGLPENPMAALRPEDLSKVMGTLSFQTVFLAMWARLHPEEVAAVEAEAVRYAQKHGSSER